MRVKTDHEKFWSTTGIITTDDHWNWRCSIQIGSRIIRRNKRHIRHVDDERGFQIERTLLPKKIQIQNSVDGKCESSQKRFQCKRH